MQMNELKKMLSQEMVKAKTGNNYESGYEDGHRDGFADGWKSAFDSMIQKCNELEANQKK